LGHINKVGCLETPHGFVYTSLGWINPAWESLNKNLELARLKDLAFDYRLYKHFTSTQS
jgi:hypothetical protein